MSWRENEGDFALKAVLVAAFFGKFHVYIIHMIYTCILHTCGNIILTCYPSPKTSATLISPMALRILFCGGGSIGHLAPSVAMWEAIREKHPESKALFVCSMRREDRVFLRANKVRFVPILAPKTGTLLRTLLFPLFFPIACLEAFLIILFARPHVILAKGGYVSVPISLVGWILRRPIVLHESDRVMGKANQVLLKYARHLCIGTPQKELANKDVMTRLDISITATGNPIRKKLFSGSKDGGRRVTKYSGKRPVLLIIGGSQGAQIINEAVWKNLDQLLNLCDVLHITGRGKMNRNIKHAHYWQREVMHEELENIYAFADVVVSRAGAGAIAELSALGKATILVPIPGLAHNHQEENARFLRAADAVVALDQKSLKDTLVPNVENLLQDEGRRNALGERFRRFSDPDAADRIANILIETANI